MRHAQPDADAEIRNARDGAVSCGHYGKFVGEFAANPWPAASFRRLATLLEPPAAGPRPSPSALCGAAAAAAGERCRAPLCWPRVGPARRNFPHNTHPFRAESHFLYSVRAPARGAALVDRSGAVQALRARSGSGRAPLARRRAQRAGVLRGARARGAFPRRTGRAPGRRDPPAAGSARCRLARSAAGAPGARRRGRAARRARHRARGRDDRAAAAATTSAAIEQMRQAARRRRDAHVAGHALATQRGRREAGCAPPCRR